MRLSIIVPVYRNSKSLDKFLKRVVDQSGDDFELVIVIDTNVEKVVEIVTKYAKLIKNMQVIYNYKRLGRYEAVAAGIKQSKGDYCILLSSSCFFESDFVKKSVSLINNYGADIIEFNAAFKVPFKFKGLVRNGTMKSTLIAEKSEVIAYTYPFEFNKLVARGVYEKTISHKITSSSNTIFSAGFIYKSLYNAKTYASVKETLVTKTKSRTSTIFSPLVVMREWKRIRKFLNDFYSDKFSQEMLYAQYFHEVVFVSAIVNDTKRKILSDRFDKEFARQLKSEFGTFFETNKYIMLQNKEVKVLKKYRDVNEFKKVMKAVDAK